MYSLILMTAMSSAPDTAEFGGFFRNLFGSRESSSGACYGSCTGYGSCAGYGSCSGGCSGGGSGGIFGGRLRAFFNSSSCYGSCSGRSSGCYGRSYSCQGSVSATCHGSLALSCQGGAWGYDPPPLPPADGGFAVPSPATTTFAGPADGGFSCLGGTPLGAPAPFGAPFPTLPSGPPLPAPSSPAPGFDGVPPATPTPAEPPLSIPDSPSSRKFVQTSGGRATVVVRLPADAKLYADGRLLTLTSAERQFVTPVLPADREFTYSFRVEYTRDGETIAQSRTVAVKAGGTAAVEFADLTVARGAAPKAAPDVVTQPTIPFLQTAQPVSPVKATPAGEPVKPVNPFTGGGRPTPAPEATDRARIIVKLPPNATLYVDGRKHDKPGTTREFSTPPLPPGREFAYLMKIETVRDGRPETLTTKVPVRAGEIVPVDFTQVAAR